jgi:trk system potassium uptake protein TrkH
VNIGVRVASAVGAVTRIFSLIMLLPIVVAFAYEPWDLDVLGLKVPRNALVFLGSFAIAALFWVPEAMLTRHVSEKDMPDRAAYLTVGVGWIALTVFGMTPFMLSGVLPSLADAFFETMSGLTTTGSTVIEGSLEDVAPSIMFWRGLLQFIGGMGIVVLSVALLSRMTQGGRSLLAAETPGTTVSRLAPKLAETARTLWMVYMLFSGLLLSLLFGLFVWNGMHWKAAIFDALMHTFTTFSTGGFSNHSASIAYYESWLIELVIIVFMLTAASSFTLHYRTLHGDWRKAWRDPELRFMLAAFAVVTLVSTGLVWQTGRGLMDSARGAAFTVASILTTTGYGTVDYDTWPAATKPLLGLLMLTGASAGSTAGGMKFIRILLLMKLVRREFETLLHPRAIIPIRLSGKVVDDRTLWKVVAFFFTFVSAWFAAGVLIVAIDPKLGVIDGMSAAASAIGNIGPGFGVVGPTAGYWDLQPTTKFILAALMWLGRLEIFTVLLIFSPRTWR